MRKFMVSYAREHVLAITVEAEDELEADEKAFLIAMNTPLHDWKAGDIEYDDIEEVW
jgi:hypothetical protein